MYKSFEAKAFSPPRATGELYRRATVEIYRWALQARFGENKTMLNAVMVKSFRQYGTDLPRFNGVETLCVQSRDQAAVSVQLLSKISYFF